MVDVSGKKEVFREARAVGEIRLKTDTIRRISQGGIEKGDPVCAAKIAGVLAAKKTGDIIPLCHPLPLTHVNVDVEIVRASELRVTSLVKTKAQTGVEMEALTATTVALLTIWDMVKQYEKDAKGQYPSTVIEGIRVVSKVKGDTE